MAKIVKESRKIKVLKTALVLFQENGFHNVPMSLISQKSDVAVGTIYHHFKNKIEIIESVYFNILTELSTAVVQNDNTILPFKERFDNIWANLYSWMVKNKKEFYFLEHFVHSPYINEHNNFETSIYGEPLTHFLNEGQQSGQLVEMNLELLVNIFYAHASALAKFQLQLTNMDKKEVQMAGKSIWKALKAKTR